MKIDNYPVPIALSEYERAVGIYLDRVKAIPGVISVNTMGSVGAPGLSDIDILVVVNDDFPSGRSSELNIRGIDNRLFLHGPVVIPHSMAKNLQYIIYASNINNIYGSSLLPDFEALSPEVIKALSICYLIDFTESRLMQYADVDAKQTINMRAWLTRLWSITHSASLLKKAGLSLSPNEESLLKEIKATRSQWLERQEVDLECFNKAFRNGNALNRLIFERTLHHLYGDANPSFKKKSFQVNNNIKKITFNDNILAPNYTLKHLQIGSKSMYFYTCKQIPHYAFHLSGYGFLDLGSAEDQKLYQHYSVMKKRRQIVYDHKVWISKHVPNAQSMSGYLGLEPYTSYKMKDLVLRALARMILR